MNENQARVRYAMALIRDKRPGRLALNASERAALADAIDRLSKLPERWEHSAELFASKGRKEVASTIRDAARNLRRALQDEGLTP